MFQTYILSEQRYIISNYAHILDYIGKFQYLVVDMMVILFNKNNLI
jgi:hypothetical protein